MQCFSNVAAHFLVHQVDIRDPLTIKRPLTSSTYWQVEHANDFLSAAPVRWRVGIRLRHLQSGNFLFVDVSDGSVGLCTGRHHYTVFKLSPMYEEQGDAQVRDGVSFRLEHAVSGRWLHGDRLETYHSQHPLPANGDSLVSVTSRDHVQYEDAFGMFRIDWSELKDTLYVQGVVPMYKALVTGVSHLKLELHVDLVISFLIISLAHTSRSTSERNFPNRKW